MWSTGCSELMNKVRYARAVEVIWPSEKFVNVYNRCQIDRIEHIDLSIALQYIGHVVRASHVDRRHMHGGCCCWSKSAGRRFAG